MDKRQYKEKVVEIPLILPRVSATLIPTTVSTTPPKMSNPTRATTPWPPTFPALANLFVTRSWPIPPNKESNPSSAEQKMMESNLPKSKSTPTRKTTISHPPPLVPKESTISGNPAATNIMAVPSMQSPGERCKALCPISAQSTTHPSQADSDWSEED